MNVLEFTKRSTNNPVYGAYCKHLLKNLIFISESKTEIDRMRIANENGKVFSRCHVDQFFNDYKKQKNFNKQIKTQRNEN